MAEAVTCAGAMMISFSTVRLARITSDMDEVWAMVVREPVAFVSDCAGASDALSRTSPLASAGSTPSRTWISPATALPAPSTSPAKSANAAARADLDKDVMGELLTAVARDATNLRSLRRRPRRIGENASADRKLVHRYCGGATVAARRAQERAPGALRGSGRARD